ncbi:ABC transporter ATP-binding protein [Corynebacterium falsenii DSM 44353]|uniref:ATP-binding cassette domain-containing protein n=1 Tax=Corynebacterium falsenii TaxID=108486 RepID=UPI0003E945B8|nr:ATP-binding cassette domain-containing protein [Corynebacterium falsenii]AHI03729.1 ABC transporter ATP-binding protein [Corynebacterium falsenii DSM 44353]UBI04458.1 ATP-binding cassette domain-containing protein [Corynebacterium falsenii]
MITVENLSKRYGDTQAFDDLTFSVPDGQVTGFLGPNGSGKSSTMRCILGLDNPSQGTVSFDGKDLDSYGSERPHVVGGLMEPTWYIPNHTASTHINSIAAAAGISLDRAEECLALVGLETVAKKKIKGFSLGMKQRLGLAIALLGDPKHLILDEPVNGLDPEGVHWMRQLIRSNAEQGRAVLVSSHLLNEMELTADRLVLIGRGKLIGEHSMDEFLNSGSATVRVRVADPAPFFDAAAANSAFTIDAKPNGIMDITADMAGDDLARVIGELARDTNAVVLELSQQRQGLEQRFLDTTNAAVDYRMGGK